MTAAAIDQLIRAGGFAVLAAVAIWSNVILVKLLVGIIETSNARERETLKMLANDREQMLRQLTDVMGEVRDSLTNLSDDIGRLTGWTDRRERDKETAR